MKRARIVLVLGLSLLGASCVAVAPTGSAPERPSRSVTPGDSTIVGGSAGGDSTTSTSRGPNTFGSGN
jgi:hypothetical protein